MTNWELYDDYIKLMRDGNTINSRYYGTYYSVESFPEYGPWKTKVELFVKRHLLDHEYAQSLLGILSKDRSRANNFLDILNAMMVIGEDKEYWSQPVKPYDPPLMNTPSFPPVQNTGNVTQQFTQRSNELNSTSETYDVFISHAAEDKESFVDSLVAELRKRGIRVW